MEMLLTGEFVNADSALEWGLVNRIAAPAELDAEVDRLAQVIRAKPAKIVAAGKRTFYEQIERPSAEAYGLACETLLDNVLADDAREGLDAFFEKRTPRWTR